MGLVYLHVRSMNQSGWGLHSRLPKCGDFQL